MPTMSTQTIRVRHPLLDYKSCIYEKIFTVKDSARGYDAVQVYAVEGDGPLAARGMRTELFTLVKLKRGLFGRYKVLGQPWTRKVLFNTTLPRPRERRLEWSANTSDTFHVFDFFSDQLGEPAAAEARENFFRLLDAGSLRRFRVNWNDKNQEIWKV